jgi:hypothetical protein
MVLQLLGESLGAARCSTRQTTFRVGCVVLILFTFCVSFRAIADDISHRYVELTGTSGRGAGNDNVGLRMTGTYSVSENLYLSAQVISNEVDTNLKSGSEFYRIGVGARKALTQTLDGVFSINYGRLDLDLSLPNGRNVGFEDSGGVFESGVRGRIGDAWEYSALLQFLDWDSRDLGYRLGGVYRLAESPVSIGLYYAHHESEWDQVELGLRYRFD